MSDGPALVPAPPSLSRPVLVIKLGALGDLVQCLDAFHAIRAHHRDQRLILLTAPPFVTFAQAMPWFDAVWSDRRARPWQLGAWLTLIRQLRRESLGRIYDLQSNQRTALYFRLLAGARPEWSGAVPGCSHPRPDFLSLTGHNHDRLLVHVASAGVPIGESAPVDWLNADIRRFALPPRFVLLIPGCSPHRPYKRWPAPLFAALVQRLAQRGLGAVAIGTAGDREAAAMIKAHAPPLIDLTGQTSLLEVAGIARAAAGTVGNDTGPVFISGVVGTPTVMVMSRHTLAERMAPLGPVVAWRQKDDLADLTVDEVEAVLLPMLRSLP